MLFYEGLSCPQCNKPFAGGDDIVTCPDCGLPHHRACWMELGHCHDAHLHNTEQQWTRPTNNPATQERVAEPTPAASPDYQYNEYKPFTQSETNTPRYDEGDGIDGISANDYAVVVGSKTHYYIPRFRRIAIGDNGGWNWGAFFFGAYWLIYRKMYLGGFLMLALNLFQTFMTTYVLKVLNITDMQMLYDALYSMMYSPATVDRKQLLLLLSIWILSAIMIAFKIMLAIFGNKLYHRHCTEVIRKARIRVPDLSAPELMGIGGTSIGVVLISGIFISFLEQLISILFV